AALLPRPGAAQPPAAGGEAARAAGRLAMAHAAAQRWAEAEAAALSADPAIARTVTWLRLLSRTGEATAREIAQFALRHPDWPAQDALARRAEEALAQDPDDRLALAWFAARPPRSLEGHLRLAEALARAGEAGQAAEALRRGWAEAPGDAAAEEAYLARAGAALTPELHWRRFDRTALLREGAPARLLPLLDPSRQGIAAARLAYAGDAPEADTPALAAAAPGDLGLTYERARWLRRRERDAEAAACWAAGAALQRDLPPAIARAVWSERHLLARKLLRLGEPRLAYATAARHGQEAPGEPRQEAEFLAGFIALRHLRDAATAERHFARLMADSQSVITRARGLYWQGRAAAAQGAPARARERYAAAAACPTAFYGQLAALALGEDGAALSARIAAAPSPQPTAAQARALERQELAQVVLALAEIGEARRARPFLLRLADMAGEPAEKLLVARLATRIGRPDHAVWVVRRAGAAGLVAVAEGWPAPYPVPAEVLEPALINAITRQESNFDPEAVSPANARGLMQLLPATAQQVARQLRLRHQTAMLTTDAAHNMRLGATYLASLIERFGGALPLAIAAYNAGPARVAQWLATYGDPRAGETAMLDWMEHIPFSETRNYVQRVIENIAIYRALSPADAALSHPMARWLQDGA
uniref:lytic transglycosylase domain-containing protein n=1 Tax=Crenalkalicoccus roseus TaxID=1485588 RepID=UPI00107FD5AB